MFAWLGAYVARWLSFPLLFLGLFRMAHLKTPWNIIADF